MRILLVSDTESEYIWDHFDAERFEGTDLVISCGDLKSDYLSFLATMIKAPLFYVHGNHDNGYIKNPPGGCDSIEDKLVLFKGLRILGLGGSMKYNYHPNYSIPPFQYTDKQMEKRMQMDLLQMVKSILQWLCFLLQTAGETAKVFLITLRKLVQF